MPPTLYSLKNDFSKERTDVYQIKQNDSIKNFLLQLNEALQEVLKGKLIYIEKRSSVLIRSCEEQFSVALNQQVVEGLKKEAIPKIYN